MSAYQRKAINQLSIQFLEQNYSINFCKLTLCIVFLVYNSNFDLQKQKMTKRIGDFSIENTIGQGTFGKVRLGTHLPTGEKVAIKILEKKRVVDKTDLIRVQRQLTILKSIEYSSIIKLLQLHETDKNIYIITELAEGIELYQQIVNNGVLDQQKAGIVFLQLLEAISYLHSNGIAHRDIKPENVLIKDNRIKLIDFGLSKQFDSKRLMTTSCGSPCYAAPEMLTGDKYNPIKTDIWALGVTLYAMTVGKLPFEDQKTQKLYKLIAKGQYQQPTSVSSQLSNLISKILNTDFNKRLTIQQIQDHKWVKNVKANAKFNWVYGTKDQNFYNIALIESMATMFNCEVSKIIDIIVTKQIPSIYTYYHLLNNKHHKSQGRTKNIKGNDNSKLRSLTQNLMKHTLAKQKQFQIYNGPIHFNYVFNGYEKVIEWINLSLKQAKMLEKNLLIYHSIQVPIKKLSKDKDLFYLQMPFYLMTKVK